MHIPRGVNPKAIVVFVASKTYKIWNADKTLIPKCSSDRGQITTGLISEFWDFSMCESLRTLSL